MHFSFILYCEYDETCPSYNAKSSQVSLSTGDTTLLQRVSRTPDLNEISPNYPTSRGAEDGLDRQ